jgi:hypothetical protein
MESPPVVRTVERHKAISIPVSWINNVPHFLVVHDRRYKEWTFVTGGCRRREIWNPIRCAVRELEEETRGIMNLKRGTYSHFKFSTKNPEEKADEGLEVLSIYHVYLFEVPMTHIEHRHIVKRFTEEKEKMETRQMAFRKNYDENDFCEFDTLEGISARSNLWPMIRTHVITNPEFHQALRNSSKQPFYIAR